MIMMNKIINLNIYQINNNSNKINHNLIMGIIYFHNNIEQNNINRFEINY
jgi:hypothetical protein